MLTDQQILKADKEVVYVVRSEAGEITGYTRSKPEGTSEACYEDDPEVVAYLDPLQTLPGRKTGKSAAVSAEFARRVAAGLPYQGKVVQIDDESRSNIQGVVNYADKCAAGAEGFQWPPAMISKGWRMKDNTYLPMPEPADIYALAGAVALYYMGLRYASAALKDAIRAAADQQALDAVDISQGWP